MGRSNDISSIYNRLSQITPGQWEVSEEGCVGFGWLITCGGKPLEHTSANAEFITQAANDIAYLAAELEELKIENKALAEEVQQLWDNRNKTDQGIDDIVRQLGGDSDRGYLSRASELIAGLLEKVEHQEAAIRTVLQKSSSDEAIQALSDFWREYQKLRR